PSSHPFHADGGHFGYDLLVTQDTRAACPPSHGTLSAMGMESLSAISGMRNQPYMRPILKAPAWLLAGPAAIIDPCKP
ncbi:MAG: hypothetical protein J0I00_10295, partial [Burkholderiales bacterium]|nr:hypothetical protein [Burkholderiales bacterium]